MTKTMLLKQAIELKFAKKRIYLQGLFFALCSFAGNTAQAKDYYISSSTGNDSYSSAQAQNQATPWRSISKLNSFFSSIVAGDNIYFKRGDIFYGTIVVTKSGTSSSFITISAYGTGNRPLISGLATLSFWSQVSAGIYEANAPAVKSTVNLVSLNGVPQGVGRYPNLDAANGGYLSYESYSGLSAVTDDQLSGSINWTGAEMVIRKQHYAMEKCKITNHSNKVINYAMTPSINPQNNSNPSPVKGTNGYGYFIQRDFRTLDRLGEWFFNNSTKKMQMYFGGNNPSLYTIRVSTLDTLINIGTRTYINVNNIDLEGANVAAIYAANAGNITIRSCDINLGGGKGVLIFNSPNILVDEVNTNNLLCGAIDLTSRQQSNATIRNCEIRNTAMIAGMGSFWDDNDYKAITVSVNSTALIEYNSIENTGFIAIQFQGSNITIKNNLVDYFNVVKDDGGGIYTYQTGTDAAPGTNYTNRVIRDNIVLHGVGASPGTSGGVDVDGIFLDGRVTNVDILNNSVAHVGVNGIYVNNSINVDILGNTSFDNGSAMGVTRYTLGYHNNLAIKDNIFYPKYNTQNNFKYADLGISQPSGNSIQSVMQKIGDINDNYYATPNATGFTYYYSLVNGGAWTFPKPMSFGGWQSFTDHDDASKVAPKVATYKISNLIGLNTVTNGQFTNNVSGITAWSPNINILSSWDNTSKITGTGSLKITPALSSTDFTMVYGKIKGVSSSKKYILRFTTRGTSDNGVVRAYLRESASPNVTLTQVEMETFNTSKTVHEFLFAAPISEADASFVIEIQQSSGTAYIDDIAFYEANATVLDIDDQLHFEYNASKVAKTIPLDAVYRGVDGTQYTGTITLAPYTSKILIKDTGSVSTGVLQVTSTPSNVNCFGGSVSVDVSATGGVAPYTGIGTYTVSAGKGTLKLSVLAPVAGNSTLLYSSIGAVSDSKNYVLKFSTVGATINGSLNVYLRETSSPYRAITPVQSRVFGTGRIDHEILFTSPINESDASFVIDVDQNSGTTYFDNVAFFEANSSGNPIGSNLFSNSRFETNISGITSWSPSDNHLISLDTFSKISNIYFYTVRDQAGNSAIASVDVRQPSSPLQATSTSGVIIVNGGLTTVTISGAGGTGPYTGTGTFTVRAGTYNYTVRDANGCSAVTKIKVDDPGTINTNLKATATAPPISCFGGNTTVTVAGSGGTSPYKGTGIYNTDAGKGSLKLLVGAPGSSRAYTLVYATIGSVSSSKSYVLRFSTLGTSSSGNLKASLRKTEAAWSYITPVQYHSFGTTRIDHEFIFSAPATEDAASFIIEVLQTSGTVYIDNIAFFESTSTGYLLSPNLFPGGQFESGINDVVTWSIDDNHLAQWDVTSKINNTNYYSIEDADGSINTIGIVTRQPAQPLYIHLSAPAIPVSGGTTTVTVTATGGTAPYSGVGTFTVRAGTYDYVVTDDNGCTVTDDITVSRSPSSNQRAGSAPPPITVAGNQVTAQGGGSVSAVGGTGSVQVQTGVAAGTTAVTGVMTNTNAPVINTTQNNALKITVYPNPSVTEFGLIVEEGTRDMVSIVVQSIDGKVLYQAKGNSNSKYVFGNNFVPGIYVVKVMQGSSVQVLRIVKGRL